MLLKASRTWRENGKFKIQILNLGGNGWNILWNILWHILYALEYSLAYSLCFGIFFGIFFMLWNILWHILYVLEYSLAYSKSHEPINRRHFSTYWARFASIKNTHIDYFMILVVA
jgi:mannose/fructose/N-acetylgalactosamine-specific phosphotransferase system component IID